MSRIFFMFLILLPIFASSQEVTNIQVTQKDKMVVINYDLKGDGVYDVRLFYSTDDGLNWNGPLKEVSGDVGIKIEDGKNHKIIWDVLAEVEELEKYCKFRVEAKTENKIESGTFTDSRDGHVYKWIKIRDQVWMADNLISTKYNDGENINNFNKKNWTNTEEGAFFRNEHDKNSESYFGLLYNWHVVKTKKICPKGWHVPSDQEWLTLIDLLGGKKTAGSSLKSILGRYNENKTEAESSIKDIFTGGVNFKGNFYGFGHLGFWWSSSERSPSFSTSWGVSNDKKDLNNFKSNKNNGFNIRCVKN